MAEYVCSKGNRIFLVNDRYNEACLFTPFGEYLGSYSASYAFGESISRVEVKIVSVLGEPAKGYCEVYYNGKICPASKNYMEVYNSIRGRLPKQGAGIFRLVHKDEGVVQILVPCKIEILGMRIFEEFGLVNWKNLNQ